MNKQILSVGPIEANCTILWNDNDPSAWIIDPGSDASRIIEFIETKNLSPVLIALTHAHFDHLSAIPELLERYPDIPVHVGPGDEVMIANPLNSWMPYYPVTPKPASLVADLLDGATLEAGGLAAKIIATPGHTPGGVCFYFESEKLVLTGDTLFAGSCGRTDFPGGNAKTLSESLKRLAKLPADTVVIPGHNDTTTIGIEVKTNPYMQF